MNIIQVSSFPANVDTIEEIAKVVSELITAKKKPQLLRCDRCDSWEIFSTDPGVGYPKSSAQIWAWEHNSHYCSRPDKQSPMSQWTRMFEYNKEFNDRLAALLMAKHPVQ